MEVVTSTWDSEHPMLLHALIRPQALFITHMWECAVNSCRLDRSLYVQYEAMPWYIQSTSSLQLFCAPWLSTLHPTLCIGMFWELLKVIVLSAGVVGYAVNYRLHRGSQGLVRSWVMPAQPAGKKRSCDTPVSAKSARAPVNFGTTDLWYHNV